MTEPRGNIYLINRAPIDITYQHTIDFTTAEEQLSFWRSLVKYSLQNYSYIRRERRFIQIDKKFEDIEDINYLFFQSRNDSKYYYCFVTGREYVNDETTRLYFELDVLQSFMFDYTWKPSYIAQGHVDRWNAEHKPIYSRTDEGLNYGSEYITEAAFRMVSDKLEDATAIPHGFYLIYLNSTGNNTAESGLDFSELSDLGTVIGGNTIPYTILIIPNLTNPKHHNYVCGYEDSTGDVTSISNMYEIHRFMNNSGIGNFIAQIVYLPYLPFEYKLRLAYGSEQEEQGVQIVFSFNKVTTKNVSITAGQRAMHAIYLLNASGEDTFIKDYASLGLFEGIENKIPSDAMWSALKSNPYTTERDRRYESKLLCFPYRYNLFTDWITTPCVIKNEFLSKDNITIKGSIGMGFNTPRRYWINDYRGDPEGREASINQLTPLEQPVISDAYYTYLLQNKNQLSANLTNAKISAAADVVKGAIGGGATGAAHGGGAVGAAVGAVGGAITAGIDSGLNIAAMLRSENAKQADIKNMPDTISNSNDITLAIADKAAYITFYRKAISCDFEEQLSQYWHLFGYIVRRVEIPNLRSRLRYNYIKTIGANIESGIEQQYITAIKAIFDNGVTIWHYNPANKLLDYSYENPERNLL